jgi:hypothetical protein
MIDGLVFHGGRRESGFVHVCTSHFPSHVGVLAEQKLLTLWYHRYKYQTMGTTAMAVQTAARRRTAPLLQDDPERDVVVAVVVDGVFCAATLGKANLVLVGVAVGVSGSSGNAVGECVVVVVAGRSCVGDKDTVGVAVGDTDTTVTGGGQGQCCWTYGCKARQRSGATRRCAAS